MTTILKSCRVPWDVSPTSSGVTLIHTETSVAPECSVIFGGSRLHEDCFTRDVRVEITFQSAWHARLGPKSDNADIDSAGFQVLGGYDDPGDHRLDHYLDWRTASWREQGLCPDASFYVAVRSDWLEAHPSETTSRTRHYVISGRDGYVEILAERFSWREWLWLSGERDALTRDDEVFRRGDGVE